MDLSNAAHTDAEDADTGAPCAKGWMMAGLSHQTPKKLSGHCVEIAQTPGLAGLKDSAELQTNG